MTPEEAEGVERLRKILNVKQFEKEEEVLVYEYDMPDVVVFDNKDESSGSNEEDYGYFCNTCVRVFDTLTRLQKHRESKQHIEKVKSKQADKELKYDKYSEAGSEDGGEKELTPEEMEMKFFKENFCRRQGFGFDCDKCCKKKRTVDKAESISSFKGLIELAEEANEMFEEQVREEVDDEDDKQSCLSDSSAMRAVREKIRSKSPRFGEVCGKAALEEEESDDEDDDGCLWNRLKEKPSRKDWNFRARGKTCYITRLDPVEKITSVPREENETVRILHNGICLFEKVDGHVITYRIVEVESLKNARPGPCC